MAEAQGQGAAQQLAEGHPKPGQQRRNGHQQQNQHDSRGPGQAVIEKADRGGQLRQTGEGKQEPHQNRRRGQQQRHADSLLAVFFQIVPELPQQRTVFPADHLIGCVIHGGRSGYGQHDGQTAENPQHGQKDQIGQLRQPEEDFVFRREKILHVNVTA